MGLPESSSDPEEVWEHHSTGWGIRDAQPASGSPKSQIQPFSRRDKKLQKRGLSDSSPALSWELLSRCSGGEFAPLVLTQECCRERGWLVFTEAEGLLGRALSKQLRASPPGELPEQRKPSHTDRGDKEPPKCPPRGHLWQGRSRGTLRESRWARGHLAEHRRGHCGDSKPSVGCRGKAARVSLRQLFPGPPPLTGLGCTNTALAQNP